MPRSNPSTQASNQAGIEVLGVSKRFADQQVLDEATLAVPRGTWVALEGQNGAGKTTLLRVCATILLPDTGTVRVLDHDVVSQASAVRAATGLALVNERSLVWRMNAVENLKLWARVRGLRSAPAKPLIAALLDELGLGPHTSKLIGQLSSGQRHRLVLARALLADPRVLLVDEPLRGLDEQATHLVLDALRKRATAGATILTAAPRLDELEHAADWTVRLTSGRIETAEGHR